MPSIERNQGKAHPPILQFEIVNLTFSINPPCLLLPVPLRPCAPVPLSTTSYPPSAIVLSDPVVGA